MAEQHAANIRKIPGCRIVGVCDREALMAEQLSEHFEVGRFFQDPEALLHQAAPDVVHITTPPQSHYELGTMCLEAGAHVLIEKPFTVNAGEAEDLISLAQSRGLQTTVVHNAQYSQAAEKLRDLVGTGFLGSRIVHMESIFCYDLGNAAYAKAALSDRRHWVNRLPGKLLHNILSHGIGQIAEYLEDSQPAVTVVGFTSDFLKRMGEAEIIDELRVIIRDSRSGATAYFTFSSQMGPKLHQFRIYGDRNGLILDDDHQSVVKLKGRNYRSYINHMLPPLHLAWEHFRSSTENIHRVLRRKAHIDARTRALIERFYQSIRTGTPLPVSHREIIATARIMDEIFAQVKTDGQVGRDLLVV